MEHCRQCGKSGDAKSIRRCSGCKAVRYCSRDCQTRHWSVHKVTCSPSKTGKSDSQTSSKECDDLKETGAGKDTDVQPPTAKGQPKPNHNHNHNHGPNLQDPTPFDPWKQAMARALEAFPGNRIVDRFSGFDKKHTIQLATDLEYLFGRSGPWAHPPVQPGAVLNSTGVVVVLQLMVPMLHPLPQRKWRVVDKEGRKAFVTLKTTGLPTPYFRYDDFQRGHFLCLKDAFVELCIRDDFDSYLIVVKDDSSVRIFNE